MIETMIVRCRRARTNKHRQDTSQSHGQELSERWRIRVKSSPSKDLGTKEGEEWSTTGDAPNHYGDTSEISFEHIPQGEGGFESYEHSVKDLRSVTEEPRVDQRSTSSNNLEDSEVSAIDCGDEDDTITVQPRYESPILAEPVERFPVRAYVQHTHKSQASSEPLTSPAVSLDKFISGAPRGSSSSHLGKPRPKSEKRKRYRNTNTDSDDMRSEHSTPVQQGPSRKRARGVASNRVALASLSVTPVPAVTPTSSCESQRSPASGAKAIHFAQVCAS